MIKSSQIFGQTWSRTAHLLRTSASHSPHEQTTTTTTTPDDRFKFVPAHDPVPWPLLRGLQYFVDEYDKLLVITGAGMSTESGIPDYRSQRVGAFVSQPYNKPITYQTFVNSEKARKRYWARNYVAWPAFSTKQPNHGHVTLARWEKRGNINWLVTQNVDRLHHKAGNERVTELHGTTYEVVCHSCPKVIMRQELQGQIADENVDWDVVNPDTTAITPDGDVILNDEQVATFKPPVCLSCGGMIRPNVVFFGDNVPMNRAHFISEQLRKCNGVLVLGSTLSTFSAYRHLTAAVEMGIPIAIVTIGQTRADRIVDLKLDGRCSEILARIEV